MSAVEDESTRQGQSVYWKEDRRGVPDIARSRKIAKLKSDINAAQRAEKTRGGTERRTVQSTKTIRKVASNLVATDIAAIKDHLMNTKDKFASALLNPDKAKLSAVKRMVLFSWLLEVATKFKLHARTIFLCAHIFDLYLSTGISSTLSLQLLGVTCLFMASKFEDIYPLKARDLCIICENRVSPSQLVHLESNILSALKFDLIFVSALDLADIIMAKDTHCELRTRNLVCLILQVFLVRGSISFHDSFELASFSVALAAQIIAKENEGLTPHIDLKSGYAALFDNFVETLNLAKQYSLSWLSKRTASFALKSFS